MSENDVWKPHLTVAAVVCRDDEYLFVRERIDGRSVLNQPAGHVEDGESLIDAVVRETLEETAWDFRPESLVGVYRWRNPVSQETFIRVCFSGRLLAHHPERSLDDGIEASVWLSPADLSGPNYSLRSPLVSRVVADHLSGQRYPLDILQDVENFD